MRTTHDDNNNDDHNDYNDHNDNNDDNNDDNNNDNKKNNNYAANDGEAASNLRRKAFLRDPRLQESLLRRVPWLLASLSPQRERWGEMSRSLRVCQLSILSSSLPLCWLRCYNDDHDNNHNDNNNHNNNHNNNNDYNYHNDDNNYDNNNYNHYYNDYNFNNDDDPVRAAQWRHDQLRERFPT